MLSSERRSLFVPPPGSRGPARPGSRQLIGSFALTLLLATTAYAYIEAPHSLGRIIKESSNVLVARVEKVERGQNLLILRKVRDLKGQHPGDVIKQNIGHAGFSPRESQTIMAWAEPGKIAVIFHNGSASETCIPNYWYQNANSGEWWTLNHGEPYLLRGFCGDPQKLVAAVEAILGGQEVVVPCMVDGDKNALQNGTAKIQRMKASLKIQDYEPKRDFVGWGDESYRRLAGMPGFSQYAGLKHMGPDALGVTAADFNGDGKPDLCLFGASKLGLFQNGTAAPTEVSLPFPGGARGASWGDFDGDGKPDVLLATVSGPKLLANRGAAFQDETARLPLEPYYCLSAASWIDYDVDKRPDILLADGPLGLRLYRNTTAGAAPGAAGRAASPSFEDVSAAFGLGPEGLGGSLKADHLAVTDVNGDGRPDFLASSGAGVLALNTPKGFVEAKGSGITYQAGRVAPAFGDFDGDGKPDLFVPQAGGASKLFRNEGGGRFSDVTGRSGDLARLDGQATCADWADSGRPGRPDLYVGRFRAPNAFFRNRGDGTFVDATEEIGLSQRIFNTRGLAAVDLNKDGTTDLVFVNEGQESAVLLGKPKRPGALDGAGVDHRGGVRP